uniref:Uncharacterized protein n=1 Tax=Physcomitrium patens TaxID=3218 RepID=A0A2K1KUJ2_PHYPA|nr:hypothetical protein PHYPA_004432 [Physcomitrium patens]
MHANSYGYCSKLNTIGAAAATAWVGGRLRWVEVESQQLPLSTNRVSMHPLCKHHHRHSRKGHSNGAGNEFLHV